MLNFTRNFQANRIALYAAATEILYVLAPSLAIVYGIFVGNKPFYERAIFLSRLMTRSNALCSALIYHTIVRRTSSRSTVTSLQQSPNLI